MNELELAHKLAEVMNEMIEVYTITDVAAMFENLADCLHYRVESAIAIELLGVAS